MRKIDILLFDQINLLDVAGPAQAFNTASIEGQKLYKTRFVSIDGNSVTSCCGLKLASDGVARPDSSASDLIIPGGAGVDAMISNTRLHKLLVNWCREPDRRLISICSGALLLASSGVLDGREATTHWSRSAQVLRQFPNVKWQIDRLYITHGNIVTSAGVTTGIDMSLAIIQQDHTSECALRVARELIVYIQRKGGQSQFSGVIDLQLTPSDVLSGLVNAIVQRPEKTWAVETMAEYCNLTERTLTRRFNKTLGTSPKRFVERIRVNSACELITAGVPLPQVVSRCGLNDQQQLQRAFKRQLGTTVNDYARRFTTDVPVQAASR